jgi:osmotically-inducible protein OsmY
MKTFIAVVFAFLLMAGPAAMNPTLHAGSQKNTPQLGTTSGSRLNANQRKAAIAERVRHELARLPYYSVFDWIEGQVLSNDTVVLRGQVIRPTTRTDALARVKKLESVARVVDQIEDLPPSSSDDSIRLAMYRALFNYNGPLFRYSTQVNPSIHIIVKNGRVALKGVVASKFDSQVAYTAARNVPGVFEVRNELRIEKGS